MNTRTYTYIIIKVVLYIHIRDTEVITVHILYVRNPANSF